MKAHLVLNATCKSCCFRKWAIQMRGGGYGGNVVFCDLSAANYFYRAKATPLFAYHSTLLVPYWRLDFTLASCKHWSLVRWRTATHLARMTVAYGPSVSMFTTVHTYVDLSCNYLRLLEPVHCIQIQMEIYQSVRTNIDLSVALIM
jgi:hypothetical protein